ncbi:acyl-CoA thioesterase/bile acid-CoA:amino acid N-acyltransferase family protein [Stenotrophomonas maltophilia]|uniref:acyl-CoA thioesterase/bile acid-CoA:amino acid N-acyltransferase family protein n=1 Tax=Stenotrophomonas maltophilia TaxID=40324 RepID=UPI0018D2A7E4|nr:acyl-CoA thioesterase/BAAT N-terminal domain-containing protein [Stenotrophomonas maltophilia]HDS1300626.1 acyl-CoA thioesterase/BAAT N-terminal domain-containing protein [Stenotrophomonas maltophilia]
MRKRAGWGWLLSALAIPAMADVRVEVDDQHGRADRIPVIKVEGLAVAETVRLRLSMQDSRGQRWQSEAVLRADLRGQVDTTGSGSEQGSYRGIDAGGLIWSMQPQQRRASAMPLNWRRAADGMGFLPQTFELEVERAGSVVARQTLQRHLMLPGVRVQRVDIGGREARLYLPADRPARTRGPALVTLGGAEGGFEGGDQYAAWLASNGYIAVSIAWYRGPGVPKDLIDVPLETVRDAVHWLQRQPGVDPQRVGLLGGSWGGIATMATAVHLPTLRAAVSWVGSPAPFRGIARDVAPADFRAVDRSPLSWQGKPLAWLPYREDVDWGRPGPQWAPALQAAMLPIETIAARTLWVGGGDDRLGDSGVMMAVAQRRLAEAGRGDRDRFLYYPDAGHLITPILQPSSHRHDVGPFLEVGGTAEGHARADREVGPAVLAFLAEAL